MLLSVRRLFNIIITHELWNAIEDYIVFGNRLNYLTISGKYCQKYYITTGLLLQGYKALQQKRRNELRDYERRYS